MRAVEVRGGDIRVVVASTDHDLPEEAASADAPGGGGTGDVAGYCFWAPLGNLEAGVYKLSLVDEWHGDIELMRRVVIPERR